MDEGKVYPVDLRTIDSRRVILKITRTRKGIRIHKSEYEENICIKYALHKNGIAIW